MSATETVHAAPMGETWGHARGIVLGVRHHGPGSARAVRDELARFGPDIVLIEGPPEADPLVPLAADPAMEPPVALLAHIPAEPSRAAFWPFAEFSPEWQAIQYAVGNGVPVRFCDLPAAHGLAFPAPDAPAAGDGDQGDGEEGAVPPMAHHDPIAALAEAAGYDDPERWWEDVVEHRGDTPFEAIAEAMETVREGYVPEGREAQREAYMRKTLRKAIKDGYVRIAAVCGAWHVPALRRLPPAQADERVLRGLPKVKVDITWVPWSHGRLASWNGYGAGVGSPGWYHHLFVSPERPVETWLARAAAVLREEDLPVSSSHVIEAVQLAHTLAAVRGRPLAGLGEVTEAVRAVLCEGDELPVELIQRQMVVGERLGHVPDATPMVPLQRDLREQQRRVKLKPEALDREIDLDLRRSLDLERSRLLHRLRLLGVDWGEPRESRSKGTFRESWTLRWRPELDLRLIEAAAWGTTVRAAAVSQAGESANAADGPLAELTVLAESCLLAGLPEALPRVLAAVSAKAALDTDLTHLMAALPALVRAQRYGDVRGTPGEGVAQIVGSLLARIRAGLPAAVTGLDDDTAADMLTHLDAVHASVALVAEHRDGWLATLRSVGARDDLHGLIAGRLTRILLDAGALSADEVATRMSVSTSRGNPPARTAAWIEGFLTRSGLLLVHDSRLLGLVDAWLTGLTAEAFADVLPLLRRTFGGFAEPERRAVGRRVTARHPERAMTGPAAGIDEDRAAPAAQTVLTILGRA